MFRVLSFLTVCIVAATEAHKFGAGSCPNPSGMVGFDYNRFLGEWHVIQQTKPEDPCLSYQINFVKQGKLRVFETSRKNPSEVKFSHRLKLKYEGTSTSEMQLSSSDSSLSASSKFRVLATDYTSYAAVYICQGLLVGHRESIEIWARLPTMSGQQIQSIHQTLVAKGLDLGDVDVVDQVSCRPAAHG